ncbi:hypothetical protein FN846DRAFT_996573 [Sphaerosporella brunnea]|uniref:Uncharacterized protein n=1 Tax=Sphaerosporella brunnea TaxID=1250544 RepID=A0A5J5F6K7_9PEZI|nr:hypothetical protein FN846DRAFT_996573 [Sphaerosporella brunnea]
MAFAALVHPFDCRHYAVKALVCWVAFAELESASWDAGWHSGRSRAGQLRCDTGIRHTIGFLDCESKLGSRLIATCLCIARPDCSIMGTYPIRAAQTGVFDFDIRIFNRLFIDVCKPFDADTGLKSRNVEKNINACLSRPILQHKFIGVSNDDEHHEARPEGVVKENGTDKRGHTFLKPHDRNIVVLIVRTGCRLLAVVLTKIGYASFVTELSCPLTNIPIKQLKGPRAVLKIWRPPRQSRVLVFFIGLSRLPAAVHCSPNHFHGEDWTAIICQHIQRGFNDFLPTNHTPTLIDTDGDLTCGLALEAVRFDCEFSRRASLIQWRAGLTNLELMAITQSASMFAIAVLTPTALPLVWDPKAQA